MPSLQYTPTWALAAVALIIIFISLLLEYFISLLTNCLERLRKIALKNAVDRLKSELMLLGFFSLFLAVFRKPVSNICIPPRASRAMLPCKKQFVSQDETTAAASDSCTSRGMTALMSEEGIHQLHIFIFVLAVMQIVYSVITMALGRAKMRRWKVWEKETRTAQYEVANDPNRFRLTRQTTFVKRHLNSCAHLSVELWIKCFFRQFFHSVAKVDYLTLRHGFILAHFPARQNTFNFQKYIKCSLQDDFKVIVGISPLMWLVVVGLLLVNVHGWDFCYWVSYLPLMIVLILGTKLEAIVSRMALHMQNHNMVIVGTPLVQPNDSLFWFGRPRFALTLLHFTLFMVRLTQSKLPLLGSTLIKVSLSITQNAFELAYFIWVSLVFGLRSCYHENTMFIITRVVLAVAVQVLCSYITLPIYALVTQMGSEVKSNVLEERIAEMLRKWHKEVREKRKKRLMIAQRPTPRLFRSSISHWSPPRSVYSFDFPFFQNFLFPSPTSSRPSPPTLQICQPAAPEIAVAEPPETAAADAPSN